VALRQPSTRWFPWWRYSLGANSVEKISSTWSAIAPACSGAVKGSNGGHLVESAEENLCTILALRSATEYTCSLSFLESRADKRQIFGKTGSGKLFHELVERAIRLERQPLDPDRLRALKVEPGIWRNFSTWVRIASSCFLAVRNRLIDAAVENRMKYFLFALK